jgi:hypothetical protein
LIIKLFIKSNTILFSVFFVSVKFGSLFYSLQGPKPFLGHVLLSTPVSKFLDHSSLSLYLADGMLFHYSPFRMFFVLSFSLKKLLIYPFYTSGYFRNIIFICRPKLFYFYLNAIERVC